MQRELDEWNKANPIGTKVTVRLDSGVPFETKTKREAYLLGGHTKVVFVDGISGAYALNRVTVGWEADV